jgi:hypothetical protein
MIFSRHKPTPRVHDKSRRVGLDVTSSRMRAVVGSVGSDRPIVLDAPGIDLHLAINLERRPTAVGRSGWSLVRKAPHHVCANFLPHVGQVKSWRVGRHALSAEAALGIVFATVAPTVVAEAEAAGLALPPYVTPPQANLIATAAAVNKLPIAGTVVAALAVVADKADSVLNGQMPTENDPERAGIVPIRPTDDGPCSVVVVDADEHALSASVVWVDRGEARHMRSTAWPKLSARVWQDKLMGVIADRCVRLCRRDPRDSADAEQALFEQLDTALDAVAANRPAAFHLRAAHWYQDIVQQPADFDSICEPIVTQVIAGMTDLIYASGVPAPPRAIWLTAAAARLPGLHAAIYENSAESTSVTNLSPDAIAVAAGRLAPRWLAGELPRQHLDSIIPLPVVAALPALPAKEPVAARRG